MPTVNVSLTEYLARFIQEHVASGHYASASEVVREGLRLLGQREAQDAVKLERLRAAVQKGIEDLENGDYTELRSEDEVDDFINAIDDEVAAGIGAE